MKKTFSVYFPLGYQSASDIENDNIDIEISRNGKIYSATFFTIKNLRTSMTAES